MKVRFSDIEMAFEYVSGGAQSEHTALLSRETGEFYYRSDIGDSDEFPDELPEDLETSPENYVEIPHRNDLDLGRQLVFDFISENLPDEYQTVRRIFSSSGAYSRFKAFLQQRNVDQVVCLVNQIDRPWRGGSRIAAERALDQVVGLLQTPVQTGQ